MTYDLDSLLNLYMSKTYLSGDNDCQMKDVNPVYPKETYIERLSRIPSVMELAYNDIVQKYINLYSNRLRNSVAVLLGASNFYNPIFEEALESYQVPLELRYLPIIESALNPTAVSRAGAVGLWQFMIGTGKQYGLEVTSLIDERRDPIKSSYAAAHYLRDLYDIFGDWTLVIASYNCGPANVRKAIARAGGEKDYWRIYPYLPAETRGYVPAFIAANYIMTHYCDHNICPAAATLPASTDTVTVTRNLHIDQVVALCNVKVDEIKALNPQYRTGLIPGDSRACTLRLTTPAMAAFVAAGDSIYTYRATELMTSRSEVEVAQVKKVTPKKKRVRRTRRRK
jgi:membrane-bound lytic murein transglycosylase D